MRKFLIICVGFFTLLGIAGSASAGLLYSVGTGANLVTIEASTGEVKTNNPFQNTSNSFGLAFHPNGTLYLTSNRGLSEGPTELFTVNPSTGVASSSRLFEISSGGAFFTAIDFDVNGVLYGLNEAGCLYTFDVSTGAGTFKGNTKVAGIKDISFDSAGFLYGATDTTIYKFDPSSGHEIAIWDIGWNGKKQLSGLMFDENDVLYATTYVFDNALFKIDITGSNVAIVEDVHAYDHPYGLSGGDFYPAAIAPVPEPGSLALLSVGTATMALTGFWRRRRSQTP